MIISPDSNGTEPAKFHWRQQAAKTTGYPAKPLFDPPDLTRSG
jgi:hypothetical protein